MDGIRVQRFVQHKQAQKVDLRLDEDRTRGNRDGVATWKANLAGPQDEVGAEPLGGLAPR